MEILSVVVDKKEAEAIERRRHREALRQERIFNVRERYWKYDPESLGSDLLTIEFVLISTYWAGFIGS